MSNPRKIAVFLPNWVGDAVMATPSLRALREHFRDAQVLFVGRPISLDVLAGANLADDKIVDRFSGGLAGSLWRVPAELRRAEVDLAILLPNSFRSALQARLGRCKRRVGYRRDRRGALLTDKAEPPRDESGRLAICPTLDYYAVLVELLGVEVRDRRMKLATTEEGQRQAEQLLTGKGRDVSVPLVMLNPGGSFGPSKMWPADRYAAVADALSETRGAQIIINAGPGDRDVAAEVASHMDHPPLVNFAQERNSLSLLKSLSQRSHLVITNDTGARHVAAAMGAAVVTVFGSTDPDRTTIDYDRERIVRADVPCSPCQKKRCPNPPGETFHQCMKAITLEMVLSASSDLLDLPAEDGR